MGPSGLIERQTSPGVLPPVRPSALAVKPRQDHERLLKQCTCPACGHHVAVPFLDADRQPLATLAWPSSRYEAESMPRLPLEFVRCVSCGHIYNARFDYACVPYSDKP